MHAAHRMLATSLAALTAAAGCGPTAVVTLRTAPAVSSAAARPAVAGGSAPAGSGSVYRYDPGPTPRGSLTDIALRFLQDLQGAHWVEAAEQATLVERIQLAAVSPQRLAVIGADVLAHAGGAALGTCTDARAVSTAAVLVLCGAVAVLVHMNPHGSWLGVQLRPDAVADEPVEVPHTDALSGLVP